MRYANYEQRAIESGLFFTGEDVLWFGAHDHPNVMPFAYKVMRTGDEDSGTPDERIGTLTGYRIRQNWSASAVGLLDQADAIDGDVERYTSALIDELQAVEDVCEGGDGGPDLSVAQDLTLVRHLEPSVGEAECSPALWADCISCILLMDAPRLILVDPQVMPSRRNASGELLGQGRIKALQSLGLSRMVLAPFVWGWNVEFDETWMDRYDYDELRRATRDGRLRRREAPPD